MGNIDHYERARLAWPILVSLSKQRKTTTYGELENMIGAHYRACGHFLGKIQEYNKEYGYPPLQSLVVNKLTAVPGGGYNATQTDDIKATHRSVFEFNWESIKNPFDK